jgi:hypothetical protein
MAGLHHLLETHIGNGTLPGAVGLVVSGNQTEMAAAGSTAIGGPPIARNSIFRFASY